MELTTKQQTQLLQLARGAIKDLFRKPEVQFETYAADPAFRLHAGAFVTITQLGELRGCIGFIVADKELYKTIYEAAQLAASEDPRFPPVNEGEVDGLSIEISVLSPPEPLGSYDEIVIGKHGLIVREGFASGLLLPQVPVEHNMDRDEYLTAICRKAGLPANRWREKQLELQAFTAHVFSEDDKETEV